MLFINSVIVLFQNFELEKEEASGGENSADKTPDTGVDS